MGSWIHCSCGERIVKNLFQGVSVLIDDVTLDSLHDNEDAENVLNTIIGKGDIVVQCKSCGRLFIERDDVYESFIKEKTNKSPSFETNDYDVQE